MVGNLKLFDVLFLGDAPSQYEPSSLLSEIRSLGVQKGVDHLCLYRYVDSVIDITNIPSLTNAVNEGFRAGTRLHIVCQAIVEHLHYVADEFDMQFKAKNVARIYSIFEDKLTQINFLLAYLSGEYYKKSSEKFIAEQQKLISEILESNNLDEQYTMLKQQIDIPQLKTITQKLLNFFFVLPIMDEYRHGFNNELSYALSYRDCNSGKTVAQILFENELLGL